MFNITSPMTWAFLAVAAPGLAHGAAALLSGLETLSSATTLASFERVEAALEPHVNAPHTIVAQLESIGALAPKITRVIVPNNIILIYDVVPEFSWQVDAVAAVADSFVGSALVDVNAGVFVQSKLKSCRTLAHIVPHDVLALSWQRTCTWHLKNSLN